jgi:aspartate racemase
MTLPSATPFRVDRANAALSLYHLLDPEVLANPYPLFHRLRREDPVHWDSYLHAWVVTRYADVLEVLHSFSADRTPTPAQFTEMGLAQLKPIAQVMIKQMLFLDAPGHTRLRGLASKAFTPARVETLKTHIRDIVNSLLDKVQAKGRMDVIADLADPLPAIVTAELLGVSVSDHERLKCWSANFAEMLGNFQHNPERAQLMLRTVEEMTSYFQEAIQEIKAHPREGLIHSLLTAEVDGDRLTEEEVIANTIVTMVGGQETTTNLIGNGLLTLLRNPEEMKRLRADFSLIPSAVEEMLRYESPSQHTARLAPSDRELNGTLIRKRQAVIAVMAAANRDPERFPDPDRFDITRPDNRHLAFGYAAHFCFGAPLARAEGQIAFQAILQRLDNLRLEPQRLIWRTNLGLRGLTSLPVSFGDEAESSGPEQGRTQRQAPPANPTRAKAEDGPTQTQQKHEMREAILDSPDKPIGFPAQLGAEERHRILVEWNRTDAPYPADQCIHQLIEAQAARTPDAIAVQHEQETLTYRDFNERANQLARHLRKLGVGPDAPVGVCLQPSLTLAVALLAVLKANGACLPLDPAYPKDRLRFMMEDARIKVLLSDERLLSYFAGSTARRVCIESIRETIAQEDRGNLETNITPRSLAYLIYTSGSTGKAKGVMLTHEGLVNYITAAIGIYGLKSTDRVLQFSSISFDIAIEEMYPTWVGGATLVLRGSDFSLASSDLLHWMRRQNLTVLSVPTAYWHELVHALSESGASLPESLRLLIVGGERAQKSVLDAWRKVAGGRVRWINTYGPTETSVISTSYELPSSGPLPSPLPIGRPINNTRIYVLDSNLQPVPVGVAGEIHIGGPGLARGYLNSRDLTNAKFIADPFASEPGARLYKTGDLARYLPNGEVDFIGRLDFQIKIRGFRVEPGEIEAVLGRHSSVREAVVVEQGESLSAKRLVAYLVPVAVMTPSAQDLRIWARTQLPDYMIPSDFVFLDELPLTPNGKVDRRALSTRSVVHTSAESHVPPNNPVESQLAGIWEEILGKRPIGVRDNFFELGGHSLLAVRLMRRIERSFRRKVPLAALFGAPTIEQFAAILQEPQSTLGTSLVVPIQPQGSRPPFFCVHGLGGAVLRFQELARHMAPEQPFYGIQAQGINGDMPVLRSVEEMAACYIGEMRKFQPEGPYYIGGYSFGGLVAFEMARQLQGDGHQIGLLALLDTYPGKAKSKAVLLSTLLALHWEQQSAYVARKLRKYRRGLRRRFDALFLPKSLKQVHKTLARAEAMYQPEVYCGAAIWFRASEKALRGLDDPKTDWGRWAAAGVEIHEIDGDHGGIVKEPMVSMLAQQLRASLEEAQARHRENTFVTQFHNQTAARNAGARATRPAPRPDRAPSPTIPASPLC